MLKKLIGMTVWVIGVAIIVSGCINKDNELNNHNFSDPTLPSEELSLGNRFNIAPITVFPITSEHFELLQLTKSDPLPNIMVGPIVADNVPITALIDIIAAENNLTVSYSDPALFRADDEGYVRLSGEVEGQVFEEASEATYASEMSYRVNLRDNRRRPLKEALDILTKNAGVYYTYKDGILEVSSSKVFFFKHPPFFEETDDASPVNDDSGSFASLSGGAEQRRDGIMITLRQLGAYDIQLDHRSNIITFRTKRRTFDELSTYIKLLKNTRDLIIYDQWIMEVALNKAHKWGIDFNELTFETGSRTLDFATTGSSSGTASNLTEAANFSLGYVTVAGNWTIDLITNFVNSHGASRTVAKPTMTLASGETAVFQRGEVIEYVSEIDNSVDDGVVSRGISSEELELGLTIRIMGSYSDGTILTLYSLTQNDLIEFNDIQTGETAEEVIRLPQTSNRSMNTTILSRPGDLILMSGILTDRKEEGRDKVPFTELMTSDSQLSDKTELIIMLRPRIIQFRIAGE